MCFLVPARFHIYRLHSFVWYLLEKINYYIIIIYYAEFHGLQKEFESIAENFKTHADARLILKYDDVISHLIYAASDMFIIPSIFEPCGLTQVKNPTMHIEKKHYTKKKGKGMLTTTPIEYNSCFMLIFALYR